MAKEKTWYIRYHKSITEKVFKEILAFLKGNGHKSYVHCGFPISYESFREHGILRNDSDKKKAFCVDNNYQDCVKSIPPPNTLKGLQQFLNINIKTEKMATKKLTKAQAVVFPVSSLKEGMTFDSKELKGVIAISATKTIHVVHNGSAYHGSAPHPMPTGYKHGWQLNITKNTVDLTYSGQFSGITLGTAKKATAVKGEGAFSNSFVVTGSKPLIKAFIEEATAAGWKWRGPKFASKGNTYDSLYFVHKGDSIHEGCHFRADAQTAHTKKYALPGGWDGAIAAAKAKAKAVAKVPEYVTCTTGVGGQFTKGRIYKTTKESFGVYYIAKDDSGSTTNGMDKSNFVPATEAAFKKQRPLFVPTTRVGGYTVSVRTFTQAPYGAVNMIGIGCYDSQQIYSLAALETILCILKTKKVGDIEHCDRGVRFNVEIVTNLIKTLKAAK